MDNDATGKAKGGVARAQSLSAERRRQIAVDAARKRWSPGPASSVLPASALGAPTPGTPTNAIPSAQGPELFAKLTGVLELGASELDVYILSNGDRVISLNKVVGAISKKDGGNLGEYIGVSALKPFIDKDLILGESREFSVPGTQFRGRGITAEHFLNICQGYVAALQEGALNTDRQREIAIQCSILLSSCAKVGLIALIDEATGYQYERAEDALQVKLRAFIADELRAWQKTFPDELWEEFGRLTNWKGSLRSRPKWWGNLVIELIYDTLDPDVADYLKKNKPPPGLRWHQQLTENFGARKLVSRCYEIIGMGKTCTTIRELREKVAQHYGKEPVQLTLYLPKRPDKRNEEATN